MISFSIKNKGAFMSKLLSGNTFDSFLLHDAVIHMAVTFEINGRLNQNFFPSETWNDRTRRPYDYAPWSDVRGYCRDCIKGKTAPSSFHFVLELKPEYVSASLEGVADATKEAVSALALNIRLDESGIHIVTGVSMKTFTPDKSADPAWDRTMARFLAAKGIDFETQA